MNSNWYSPQMVHPDAHPLPGAQALVEVSSVEMSVRPRALPAFWCMVAITACGTGTAPNSRPPSTDSGSAAEVHVQNDEATTAWSDALDTQLDCSLQVAPAEVTLLADGSARPLVLSNPCAEDVWLEWLRLDGQPTVRVSWDFAGQHELAGGTIFSGLVLDIAGLSSATLLVRNAAGNCNLGANALLSFGTSAGQLGHVDIVGCGAPAP